jgi:MYXO-CTERM domain-containing protein
VADFLGIAGFSLGVGDFFSLISARVVAHQLAVSGAELPFLDTVQASDTQVPVGDPVPPALTEVVPAEDQPHHDGGCSTGGGGGGGLAIAVLALARRRRRNNL